MRRLPFALLAIAIVWIAALVQRGLPLGWDEVEFFRATRWIAEGQLPFRDYWEHHTPLQWFVFAPVAFFANGPGAESIVLLRWAQVPLWIAIFAALFALAKEVDARARWIALALLLASWSFVSKAIEYRVDVLGNLGYIAAVWLVTAERRRPRRLMWRRPAPPPSEPAAGTPPDQPAGRRRSAWILFGVLMSVAVLANMRLAPLIVLTAIVLFARERSVRALWMIAGVAVTAALFVGYLFATGSWQPFLDGIVHYNVTPGRAKLEVATFGVTLLAPFWSQDIAAIAIWLLGIAGAVLAWRTPLRYLSVLFALSIFTVWILEVHYEYHFQNPYLLMLPLAAVTLSRMRELWRNVALAVVAVALLLNFAKLFPAYGREMDYQDQIMTDVDRLTRPDEVVFEGVGFALRRPPAYDYWFLPTGVRMMAAEKLLPPYDVEQLVANPPAAVIFDLRVSRWFDIYPRLARYTVRHYVPVHRNLWVPGMTVIVGPHPARVGWIAPRAGQYDVWSSELLVKHPWLTKPEEYVAIRGPRAAQLAIPLERLPSLPADALQWRVDGIAQPRGSRTLTLRKGSRVELLATPTARAGVLLVPRGITTLCLAPPDDFVF
jgi:hypothetical protein